MLKGVDNGSSPYSLKPSQEPTTLLQLDHFSVDSNIISGICILNFLRAYYVQALCLEFTHLTLT